MTFKTNLTQVAGFLLAIAGLVLTINSDSSYATLIQTLSPVLGPNAPITAVEFSWICLAIFWVGIGMMLKEMLLGS